ncbi:MAG: glycosyltransferase family 4 protein [bacterium]|nr:glycosyltransferase family 4 protein [bacterium]
MNILILSWRGPGHPNAGGAEISTHEHAKGWVKVGHCVTLFTSYYQGAKRKEQIDGVTIIREGRQFFGVQWEALKWYLFKDHPKYDLAIDQFHGIPFFTPLYVKERKLAFIHEVTKEVWKMNALPRPFNLIPALVGPFFEPLIFKFFYNSIPFMTVSESTKKDLVNWGIAEDKITIINNGVNIPDGIKKCPKENKKTLVYLGAISKDKGIEDALRIFSFINKTNDWQFWVIGKSDSIYMNYLQRLANDLGLNNKVKFWGFVSELKKFELLSKAHLLMNPSIREGWGLVVIEAAVVGTPTVAFNVSGLRDSIINDKTGILSDERSIEGLANKILELFKDERKLKEMSKNAILWSRNFSWEKATNMSLKLITKIAG